MVPMSFVFVIGLTERAILASYTIVVPARMPARPMHRSQRPIRIGYTELVIELVINMVNYIWS